MRQFFICSSNSFVFFLNDEETFSLCSVFFCTQNENVSTCFLDFFFSLQNKNEVVALESRQAKHFIRREKKNLQTSYIYRGEREKGKKSPKKYTLDSTRPFAR